MKNEWLDQASQDFARAMRATSIAAAAAMKTFDERAAAAGEEAAAAMKTFDERAAAAGEEAAAAMKIFDKRALDLSCYEIDGIVAGRTNWED